MRFGTAFRLLGCLVLSSLPGVGQSAQQPSAETHLIGSLRGDALFNAYCSVCHGMDGKGAGPMAKSLRKPPSNLTTLALRSGGTFPLARIERVIAGEEVLPSGHGTREMPIWGPVFSQVAWDEDLGRVRIRNLALYLEKMQAR